MGVTSGRGIPGIAASERAPFLCAASDGRATERVAANGSFGAATDDGKAYAGLFAQMPFNAFALTYWLTFNSAYIHFSGEKTGTVVTSASALYNIRSDSRYTTSSRDLTLELENKLNGAGTHLCCKYKPASAFFCRGCTMNGNSFFGASLFSYLLHADPRVSS